MSCLAHGGGQYEFLKSYLLTCDMVDACSTSFVGSSRSFVFETTFPGFCHALMLSRIQDRRL